MQEGLVREVSLVVSSNGVNDAPIRVQVTLVPGTATREWYNCPACTVVYCTITVIVLE